MKFKYIGGFQEVLDKFTEEQGLWGISNLGQISYEEVTKPAAVRGSVTRGNIGLHFHCSFILSMNTDSVYQLSVFN